MFKNNSQLTGFFQDNAEIILFIITFATLLVLVSLIFVLIFNKRIQAFIEKTRKIKTRKLSKEDIDDFINKFASALAKLSYDKTGAIIIIENRDNMDRYIESGKRVYIDFFIEFVTSVFTNHKSPLHDGAMILRNFKIVSLSSYLPMTKKVVPVKYGARHRAAFGICEYYDCLAFVVSETNGDITYSHNDELYQLSKQPEELVNQLSNIIRTRIKYDFE
ncbi:MAG: diadenylate cyclase [Mycoplasma sp.]